MTECVRGIKRSAPDFLTVSLSLFTIDMCGWAGGGGGDHKSEIDLLLLLLPLLLRLVLSSDYPIPSGWGYQHNGDCFCVGTVDCLSFNDNKSQELREKERGRPENGCQKLSSKQYLNSFLVSVFSLLKNRPPSTLLFFHCVRVCAKLVHTPPKILRGPGRSQSSTLNCFQLLR